MSSPLCTWRFYQANCFPLAKRGALHRALLSVPALGCDHNSLRATEGPPLRLQPRGSMVLVFFPVTG